MPDPISYVIEPESKPGYVLTARAFDVVLARQGSDPTNERWILSSVFQPELGLAGWFLKNLGSGTVLKFRGGNKPVEMGGTAPLAADVVWAIEPDDDQPYWSVVSLADDDQALDANSGDLGEGVLTWGRKNVGNQRWRFQRVPEHQGHDVLDPNGTSSRVVPVPMPDGSVLLRYETTWAQTFRSILVTGAQIALKVLPVLLAAAERRRTGQGEPEPGGWQSAMVTGPLEWDYSQAIDSVQIKNVDPAGRPLMVTFTPALASGSTPASVVLQPNGTANVDGDLQALAFGQVGVGLAKLPSTAHHNSGSEAGPAPEGKEWITFISSISRLGTTGLVLALGVKVSLSYRGQNIFDFTLQAANPLRRAKITKSPGQDGSGSGYSAEADFKEPDVRHLSGRVSTYQYVIPLPPGVLTGESDVLENFAIEITAAAPADRHRVIPAPGAAPVPSVE